jgi:hypothetical protein
VGRLGQYPTIAITCKLLIHCPKFPPQASCLNCAFDSALIFASGQVGGAAHSLGQV